MEVRCLYSKKCQVQTGALKRKPTMEVIELELHTKPALCDREVTATTISALADGEAEPSSITVNSFRVRCRSQHPSTALKEA